MTQEEQKKIDSEREEMHIYFCNEYQRINGERVFWKIIAIVSLISLAVLLFV
ncbi:MAG: hypothetical protein QM813_21865 [Verrucomicrobiota bacterium]